MFDLGNRDLYTYHKCLKRCGLIAASLEFEVVKAKIEMLRNENKAQIAMTGQETNCINIHELKLPTATVKRNTAEVEKLLRVSHPDKTPTVTSANSLPCCQIGTPVLSWCWKTKSVC